MTQITLPACLAPTPVDRTGARVGCFPALAALHNFRRVGIHIFTFEACSGFHRITARWIAQPPKAAFLARHRPGQFPTGPLASYQINRQLSGCPASLVIYPAGAH